MCLSPPRFGDSTFWAGLRYVVVILRFVDSPRWVTVHVRSRFSPVFAIRSRCYGIRYGLSRFRRCLTVMVLPVIVQRCSLWSVTFAITLVTGPHLRSVPRCDSFAVSPLRYVDLPRYIYLRSPLLLLLRCARVAARCTVAVTFVGGVRC